MSEFDSPWKDAVEQFFEPCVALLFPAAHADIDWSRGVEWLDKELSAVLRESETGRLSVDKLARVWLRSGAEQWVLIHIEVQSHEVTGFGGRMYGYHIRLYDLYNRPVASFAVLADDRATWRPGHFGYNQWGCSVDFRFPSVKLLDFDEAELERSDNPFATVVLAHRRAMETSGDLTRRRLSKVRLIKGLYDRGWGREDVRRLFRLIDWLIDLPRDLEQQVWREVQDYLKEKQMPFLTSMERMWRDTGLEEGRQEGRQEGHAEGWEEAVELMLTAKFGPEAADLMREIRLLSDRELRRKITLAIASATNADDVRRVWKGPS